VSERIDGYAAAAYALASAEGELDRVEQELFAIGRAVETSPELRDAHRSPLPLERKEAIVRDVVGAHASRVTVNLVSMIMPRVGAGTSGDRRERWPRSVAHRPARPWPRSARPFPLDEATVARSRRHWNATGGRSRSGPSSIRP
jgi:hypothetical protein